jgi:hypothetical protein
MNDREGEELFPFRPPSPPDAEFISIPEWARRVGVSADSAYKAARLRQIPGCFPIGRLYRVNWPVFVERAAAEAARRTEGPGDDDGIAKGPVARRLPR